MPPTAKPCHGGDPPTGHAGVAGVPWGRKTRTRSPSQFHSFAGAGMFASAARSTARVQASDNYRRGLTGSPPEFDAAGMAEREDIAGGSDTVLATYREIAARFGLGSHAAARVKAKRQIARGHWSAEPANHPADPIRVRIPRAEWGRGAERSAKPDTPDIKPTRTARSAAVRVQLEFERSRADRAEAEVAELRRQLEEQRERAGTAEQESVRLRGQLAQALAALDEVRDAVAALNTDVARAVAAYRGQSFLHSVLGGTIAQVIRALASAPSRIRRNPRP